MFYITFQKKNKSLFVIRITSILVEHAPTTGFYETRKTHGNTGPAGATSFDRYTLLRLLSPSGQVGTTQVFSAHGHKHRGAEANDAGGRVEVEVV